MEASQYRNYLVYFTCRKQQLGSEHIPNQQTFVEQYGIRSVVGMGGLLPSGEFFAVILFSRVVISPEVAALFRTLGVECEAGFSPICTK